jgi:aquaglyceroporin related protein
VPFISDVSAFFSEFLGTAMLLLGLLTFTDQKNGLPSYLVPIGLFITLYGIGAALGLETGTRTCMAQ